MIAEVQRNIMNGAIHDILPVMLAALMLALGSQLAPVAWRRQVWGLPLRGWRAVQGRRETPITAPARR